MIQNVVLIRFSSRSNGNCAAVDRKIKKYYEHMDVQSFTIDSSVISPCSYCDYECLKQGKKCPKLNTAQIMIMDAICNADLVYFIVPNYCGYPCANYFAFNERTVGYFNSDSMLMQKYMEVPKRFIIISNTEEQNFVDAMQQQIIGDPDLFILKSSKYGTMSINGDIMESEAGKADLWTFLKQCSI